MTLLRPFFGFLLALTLAVTSLFMAVSRGQVSAGVEVEICSAGGFVTVSLDAQGTPFGPAKLCPDLVLGFFADAGLPVIVPVFHPREIAVQITEAAQESAPLPVPNPGARGPPLSV